MRAARVKRQRGDVDVGRVNLDGLQWVLAAASGVLSFPRYLLVSLLGTADVARDGPRRDAEGLADLLKLRPASRSSKMRATVSTGSGGRR